jgi:cytochrome P450
MPLVTELDLPDFDDLDPTLTGARFHAVLEDLQRRSWIARSPFAYFVFERKVVDEMLCFEPMAPFDPRLVPEDREINGVTFPAGSLVFACIATANRDATLFARPDELDVTAERAVEHFSFAPGMRYCLGASLARAEIEETLAFLPSRMRDPRPDGEMKFGAPSAGIYAMRSVPVAFAT